MSAILAGLLLMGCSGRSVPGSAPAPGTASASVSASAEPSSEASVAPSASPRALTPAGRPSDVTTGLDSPWSIVFVDGTALVSERDTARILELRDDGSTRLVGVVDGVHTGGESGLLGLAVDDQMRLYAYSTAADENRVQRFPLRGAPGSFTLGEPTTIVDGIPAAARHDGGRIAFGPDGLLYVATGDATDGALAQDRDSLAGKILRMTPDGDVPADNPFPGSLVYSYGHRNVEGLAWTADGTMFATEFGLDTWDELNVIVAGRNYGWPKVEGIAHDDRFVDPVQQWHPSQASPSGLTAAGGTLFVANLRGEVVRSIPVADPGQSTEHWTGRYGRIRDVTVSPDGELWMLTNNTDGRGDPRTGDDRILRVALE